MNLVEIIRGHATSDETYQITKTLAEKMQKVTVCAQRLSWFYYQSCFNAHDQ